MMSNRKKQQDRGQVGIGTLIVFIALVLVAAIAAGVLINTAGFLQSQAEATGQESTKQVADGLQVQTSTATVDSDSGEIEKIELEVGLASGSNPVNVTQATLEWVGENDASTLEIVNASTSTEGGVPTDGSDSYAYIDGINNNEELTSSGDSTTIIIAASSTDEVNSGSVSELENDLPMTENEEATVTITTRSGAQTVEVLDVPNILQDGEGVNL